MTFVGVSLFVSGFLIVNTFSMLVSQRSREFGLLRAVGATSRQVFATVVGEALVVGAAASAAGFGLGVAVAHGMHWLLPTLGIQLPEHTGDRARVGRPRLASVGTTVTVLASPGAGVRAGRVPPMAAMLGLSTRSRRTSRVTAALFGVVALIGLAVAAVGCRSRPASRAFASSAWARSHGRRSGATGEVRRPTAGRADRPAVGEIPRRSRTPRLRLRRAQPGRAP